MINAAIIGSGIGLKHFEAINGYRNSKVKIICENNFKKIKELRLKFRSIKIISDENEIFKDKEINLVSIASYDNDHFSQIKKCIRYNKHIIVEKPMCLNLKQLNQIKILLKKNPKIKIISNLVLRENSLFLGLKKETKVDDIFYIEADYIWGRRQKLFQWRSKIKDYSVTLGAGIHMIDLVMWLLNKKPQYVTSYSNNIVTRKTNFKKQSFLIYIFEFSKNIVVKITANAVGIYKHFHEVKIFEKKKTLVNNFLGSYIFNKKGVKTYFKKLNYEYPDKKNRKKIIQNFIDILIDKKSNSIISFKDQYNLMKVCFAADRSIVLKKKIKIKY
tara:strand:- start:1098 stop:2087 length:990 start_codon:yes stop_codon:yes gene_type:complete